MKPRMKRNIGRSALVVEGGGMRGMFAAGVLNAFGKAGFDLFDLYIGVSAGACNLASYLAGQYDRNYYINTNYSSTPRFISLRRFMRGGHYMDLDWLWDITIREYRLDLKTLFGRLKKQKKDFIVVATSMETGKALYLHPDESTLEHYLKVSSSLPVLYRTILDINNERATDGGIADSIPVIEAYRRGATRITVIRSRPSGYVKKRNGMSYIMSLQFRKYPRLVEAFKNRAVSYMDAVGFINHPPAGLTMYEIAPPSDVKISRVTRSLDILKTAYQRGIDCGSNYIEQAHGGRIVTEGSVNVGSF